MRRIVAILICLLSSGTGAGSTAPELTASLGQAEQALYYFDGCVECSGPWSISASASRGALDEHSYGPEALIDNNLSTCWAVEGGLGHWFAVTRPAGQRHYDSRVHGFTLLNGYTKSAQRWRQNSRIKTLEVSVDGKLLAEVKLHDSPLPQTVDLPLLLGGEQELRMRITSVYPGSYYDDLCVSEFQLEAGH